MDKLKIVFFGDSITDMNRDRNNPQTVFGLGVGYPYVIASELARENPIDHEIYNRGISGDRTVDLYARIKADVWNLKPDLVSILIGINDIWHEELAQNGVDIERFKKVYEMIIEDTLKKLEGVKIVLLEPFLLKSKAVENLWDKYEMVRAYAKVVKELAEKYNLYFIPLQDKFNEYAEKYGIEAYLFDGVHPAVAGATLIGDEWVKFYKKEIKKN